MSEFNQLITRDGNIVILTGAGISKESGLDTFRDANGLWTKVRIEDVATPEAYQRDPAGVLEFYNARRRSMASSNIQPNAAHQALAELEANWPGKVLVVTQNIDNLHERGGTKNLIHMHGEMLKVRCAETGEIFDWTGELSLSTPNPSTGRTGTMRPHVVWFGEMPLQMDEIYEAIAACHLFISIGTSGNVYPAAGFVSEARRWGQAHTVELNLEPSEGASLFHDCIHGPATEIVPKFIADLLARSNETTGEET